MDRLGGLGSPKDTSLLIEDRREHTSGSISAESSPTSEDRVTLPCGNETLKRQRQSTLDQQIEADDDYQIDPAEKKRRLTIEQVNFLERSFEVDMKLEPERKAFLAKQLGVFPRQVAIWFQNRRARWKNKQLEQDYEILKAQYSAVLKENESLKKENRTVVEENKMLMAEVARLIISQQSLNSSSHSGLFDTLDGSQVNGTRGQTVRAFDCGNNVQQLQQYVDFEDGYLSSSMSELIVPTISLEDQSDVQDSGRSYHATVGMAGASEDWMGGSKLDNLEDLFGNTLKQYPIQQLAGGGLCVEDAHFFNPGGWNEWAGFSQCY